MNSKDLILPFGLPPPELAKDLLRQLQAPALATLLGRGQCHWRRADPYARVLPHQAWLLGRMDEPARLFNVAQAAMAALNLPAEEGNWFVLHPAHFHIARDHIVLTDLRQLSITESHARALFELAAGLFTHEGMKLVWGGPKLWFLRADSLVELETSAPDVAVGHNIDIWMPKGDGERLWRRIHNEVQMSWHVHPVNEAREMSGEKPVNALWCWNATAAGAAGEAAPATPSAEAIAPLLPAFLPASLPNPGSAKHGPSDASLMVLDPFTPTALAGDWGRWLDAMQEAETHHFAPALQALKSGELNRLRLIFSDDRQLLQAECSAFSMKKFWRRPSLDSLLTTREQTA